MRLRQRQPLGLQSSRMLSDQGGLTPEMAHPHASGGLLPFSSAVTNSNEDEGADLRESSRTQVGEPRHSQV